MQRYFSLAAFVVLVFGVGSLIGLMTLPGDWYAGLVKPWFNPPNWIFAPVWSVLYVLIAVAGWRTWQREPSGPAMRLWLVQLAFNFLWSPVFFGAHKIGAALVVIAMLFAAIVWFIAVVWNRDRTTGWLFVPYGVWVAFATLLNAAIWSLN